MIEVLAAVGDAPASPQWYEVIGGAIAIPATFIAAIGGIVVIQKTRLESRRIELDIAEKHRALAESPTVVQEAARTVLQPFADTRRFETLIMRFVVLWLALILWDTFDNVVSVALSGLGIVLSGTGTTINVLDPLGLVLVLIRLIPDVGRIIIAVAFGWPLLREINRTFALGLSGPRRARNRAADPAG